jgi:hypothetical protein
MITKETEMINSDTANCMVVRYIDASTFKRVFGPVTRKEAEAVIRGASPDMSKTLAIVAFI